MTGTLRGLLRFGQIPRGSIRIVGVNEREFFEGLKLTVPTVLTGFQDILGFETREKIGPYTAILNVVNHSGTKKYQVDVYDERVASSPQLPEHLVARKTVDNLTQSSRLYFATQRELEKRLRGEDGNPSRV